MVNFVIFKAEQRNKRRSVFRLIVKYPLNFSAPLVSKCLLISTVYKCALVVLCGYLIPFLLSVFVLLRMKSLSCCWCRLLLSLCLIVVFLSKQFLYVPSMLFLVYKEITIYPDQIYNIFNTTKVICDIRGNFLFSACSVHDQTFTTYIISCL